MGDRIHGETNAQASRMARWYPTPKGAEAWPTNMIGALTSR